MKIILDSNIIFSALISGKDLYLEIFQRHKVYMPDIVLSEINKYETRLIKKTKMNYKRFRIFTQMLFEGVTVIPKFAISTENWQIAYKLCKDIDEKDAPFVALSLELEIPLWSNDKSLCEGIKKKGFNNFVTTEELLKENILSKENLL